MQFSRLCSSKMEISETDFFNTLTIQNYQISHVKHVLAPFYVFFPLYIGQWTLKDECPFYVFFTLFGCWG